MTEKQFTRAKEIKNHISDLEKLKGVSVSYSGGGEMLEGLFENPVYIDFAKIEKRLTSQWERLIDSKIEVLKKEFTKL